MELTSTIFSVKFVWQFQTSDRNILQEIDTDKVSFVSMATIVPRMLPMASAAHYQQVGGVSEAKGAGQRRRGRAPKTMEGGGEDPDTPTRHETRLGNGARLRLYVT